MSRALLDTHALLWWPAANLLVTPVSTWTGQESKSAALTLRVTDDIKLTGEVTHPTALTDWRADPHGYCPPGGETHAELRRRSAAVLAEITASNTRTVVVGHGVSGAVLRGLNLGLDARAMFVLEKPQDAFFRLLAGVEEKIRCD